VAVLALHGPLDGCSVTFERNYDGRKWSLLFRNPQQKVTSVFWMHEEDLRQFLAEAASEVSS
jgi:hypothetical protein